MSKSLKPLNEGLIDRFVEELLRVYHAETTSDLDRARIAKDLNSDPATISKVISKKMEPSKDALINAVKFIQADGNYIMAGGREPTSKACLDPKLNEEIFTLRGELKAYKHWYDVFMKDIRDLLLKTTPKQGDKV